MATKHNCECLENAGDDEPIFVLRAKDKLAPYIIRHWAITLSDNGGNVEKIEEARQCADAMEDWQHINGKKLPD